MVIVIIMYKDSLSYKRSPLVIVEILASAASAETTDTASDGTSKKKGRTVTVTADDMQKRKNDVKARTTLLLSLLDEHQLRFSKYKTVQELWAMILKTFDGNEATKKTKKNLLKQQYGNFKAKGTETLEQTFNRLQVIVSQLQFIDVEIEQDDLNQKFLTSLAPEWLMHTIKKSEPNPQNMAFISSAKHSIGNEYVTTTSVSTASTNVPTASTNVGIDEDDMEEMDIKWNMALLSMRADKFWKKTWKKIRIQGIDVAGFDKSKVECFNCHKMGHFARECRAPRSQDRGMRDNYRQGSKVEEQAPKATSAESKVFDNSLCSKDCFQTASKDLDSLLESQRLDKNKERLGYSAVPPLPVQIYSSPKKDMSWTGLPKFKDDSVTDYSRPAPTIESSSDDAQNKNPSVTEEASPSTMSPKSFIKFVKANDSPTTSKIDKAMTAKKPPVKYAELYRKTTKRSTIMGNQRNWNNLKSQQLGENFVMKNKACFNYDHFDHLSYNCGLGVKMGRSSPKNNYTHRSMPPRPAIHRPYRPPMRPVRPNMNAAQPKRTSFYKPAHSYNKRPFQVTTQNLVAILIQRVKRLERELKARTAIHKVERGRSRSVMAWVPKKV
nr:hypothetical protein [Tanacetum cinerariifolium]